MDALADQPPGDRVGVRVDLHRAVGPHAPAQLARRQERAALGQRPQRGGLVAREARQGRLPGGAVDAEVGHLARPALEMRLERRKALEGPPRHGVALHVAHAALVLALRASPVGRAGPDPEAPVPREGVQLGVQHHLPRDCVVADDEGAGVVQQHLLGHAAEGRERPLHPLEPVLLTLAREGAHVDAPRVAQGGDEQEHRRLHPADLDPPLPKVDLQLLARARLEPHRRPRLGPQRLAQRRHRPLHGAQADLHALLCHQLLTHHVRVARMPPEALSDPALQPIQRTRPGRRRRGLPAALPQPPPNRRPRAPELRRDPPCAPTERLEPQHRRHVVRLLHLDPPQTLGPRKRPRRRHGHPDPLLRSAGGPDPHVASGPVCRDA